MNRSNHGVNFQQTRHHLGAKSNPLRASKNNESPNEAESRSNDGRMLHVLAQLPGA